MDSEQIIEQLMQQLAGQIALNQSLTATIHGYGKAIEELQMAIVGLQATILELCRQHGQNSSNSSKPPSSDGYRKPNPRSQRRKGGKKPGGQIGQAGSHIEIPHEPDEVKRHVLETCKTCPRLTECTEVASVSACGEKRYVVDVVVTTKVTEHQAMTVSSCPYGKGTLAGGFPTDVKAYVQYGDSVSVLA